MAEWGTGAIGTWVPQAPARRERRVAWHARVRTSCEERGVIGGEKASGMKRENENWQTKSAWNALCIYLAIRIHKSFTLTSSSATVAGVCTYA